MGNKMSLNVYLAFQKVTLKIILKKKKKKKNLIEPDIKSIEIWVDTITTICNFES